MTRCTIPPLLCCAWLPAWLSLLFWDTSGEITSSIYSGCAQPRQPCPVADALKP